MGGTASVYLVQHKTSHKNYAMKVIKKSFIHENKLYNQIQTERDILASNRSPYTMRLYESFFDEENLYFITPYAGGGDLMNLVMTHDIFPEDVTRFYISEILLGIEYLHGKGITIRDLKFENILIGLNGHLIITDFGLSATKDVYDDDYFSELITLEKFKSQRRLSGTLSTIGRTSSQRRSSSQRPGLGGHKRSQTMVPLLNQPMKKKIKHQRRFRSKIGTLSYMSKSVLEGNYSPACDLWSLGIIMFEALYGHPPFDGQNDEQTFQNIMNYRGTLTFPDYEGIQVSQEAKLFINRLVSLEHDASTIQQIKNHPYLNGIDWNNLQLYAPPFVPELKNQFDLAYFPVTELHEQKRIVEEQKAFQEEYLADAFPIPEFKAEDVAFDNFPFVSDFTL